MDEDTVRRVTEQAGIIPTDVQKFQVSIGAYMRWDYAAELHGVVTSRRIGLAPPAPPPSNVCRSQYLLDLMGYSRTGADGSVIVHVREFVCWDDWKVGSEDEVWVVATPRSTEPVFLTHVVQVPPVLGPLPPPPPNEVDMQIRVFSWDVAGQPKPNVFFTWRAVLPASIPTLDED